MRSQLDVFQARGLAPFQYEVQVGFCLKYYQAPDEAYDDREAMVEWAELGSMQPFVSRDKAESRRSRAGSGRQVSVVHAATENSAGSPQANYKTCPTWGPRVVTC